MACIRQACCSDDPGDAQMPLASDAGGGGATAVGGVVVTGAGAETGGGI